MKVSERLYNAAAPIWEQCILHPFVQGMADGSLSLERYQYYTMQDDLYIVEYTKPFAYGVIKAQGEKDVFAFAQKVPAMIEAENDMHKKYLRQIGITEEMVEKTKMNMVNTSYTGYMISVAAQQGLAEIVTAVLPCSWCYEKIGEFMEKNAADEAKNSPVFGPWIAMYTDPGFRQMNDMLIAMVDEYSKGYTQEQIENLEKIIVNSSKYEKLFWDASWNMADLH